MRERARRAERTRGTASVEIVVMLPLFVILLAGVYHLHASGSAALVAAERARGCAFQYAVNGCESAEKAELCRDAQAAKGNDVKSESDARSEGGDETSQELARSESILDRVEDIPVLGALVRTLFGEGAVAVARTAAPGFMESEDGSVEKSYYIVCNTVSKGWSELIRDQVCSVVQGPLGLEGRVLGCK